MKDKDTPLIRRGERRNATLWFYGVGAALTLLTLVLLLFWNPAARPAAPDPPAGVAPGEATGGE